MLKWMQFVSGTFVVALLMVAAVRCEYFSSVDSLDMLSTVEKEMIQAAREYVVAQRSQFAVYRKFVERIQEQHNEAIENLENYLGNPLNAYKLIKRLVIDWEHLHNEILQNKPREEFRAKVDKIGEEYGLPGKDDLRGAIKGLARIQEVYNISSRILSDGDIEALYPGSELEWYDCYEIGVHLFEERLYKRAISWFDVALELLENPDDPTMIINHSVGDNKPDVIDVYEYLALAYHEIGDTNRALLYIDAILSLEPNHKVQQVRTYIEMTKDFIEEQLNPPDWHANYTSLCQGISLPDTRSNKRQRPQSCYLDSSKHAYFTLAPIKVEPISLDPQITMYHDLLNDNQIEAILTEAAELEMRRSSVSGGEAGKSIVRDIRVSQQTWMDYKTPVMRTVRLLVQLIGGFNMNNSELMQMANYGIGGLYEPHHDYFQYNLPVEFEGDRIATNMFYLSDVELGGYTVFPMINTFLEPVKGALVMWYNLHRSLDVDARTLHAGCPVIKGSKRIGNIWVHSGLQEFQRPCGLQSDAYKSVGYEQF